MLQAKQIYCVFWLRTCRACSARWCSTRQEWTSWCAPTATGCRRRWSRRNESDHWLKSKRWRASNVWVDVAAAVAVVALTSDRWSTRRETWVWRSRQSRWRTRGRSFSWRLARFDRRHCQRQRHHQLRLLFQQATARPLLTTFAGSCADWLSWSRSGTSQTSRKSRCFHRCRRTAHLHHVRL